MSHVFAVMVLSASVLVAFSAVLSVRFQPPLRTQKASPRVEFGNPADLIDQFTFFSLPMPFVPQDATLLNPVRVRSLGE